MRFLSYGRAFANFYARHLKRRPLFVKSVTSGALVGLADCLSQLIRNQTYRRKYRDSKDSTTIVKRNYNYRQTFWMAMYGALFVAPFAHSWYAFLERTILPLSSAAKVTGLTLANLRLAFRRAMVDQLSVGPVFNTGFFVSRGLIAGKSSEEIGHKMRSDFLQMTGYGFCLWVPAQFMNFLFIPLHYRVLFINMVGLSWSTFSNLKVCYEINTSELPTKRIDRREVQHSQRKKEAKEELIHFMILYADST